MEVLKRKIKENIKINSPEKAFKEFFKKFGSKKREHLICIGLNSKNQALYCEIVAIGTLNSCLLHPREIFKKAIIKSCNMILLGHNHPSGDLNASKEDIEATETIKKAGVILGIALLDHIIFNKKTYKGTVF
jgi:DNA repair protein RadC